MKYSSSRTMANFSTREGNYTGEMNHTSRSTWPTAAYAFLPALNIFLSITASLGNALILVALYKESTLHPPTKLLFRCLAVTDLCVGFISQSFFGTLLFALFGVIKMYRDVFYYLNNAVFVSRYVLCVISISTSTAISVDRLLALSLGLRYRHVVTLKRTRAVTVCFFVIGVSCGAFYFWSFIISWLVIIVVGVLCLIISILSYTKIYFTLRQHEAQLQDHVHQGQPNRGKKALNIARYKKTVYSIACVQLALLACYVPFIVMSIVINTMAFSATLDMIWLATITLVYFNSSLNPILYCWKIKEVRQAVKDAIRQCCCLCS